jgi:ornithine cyclodeaminase
VLNDDATGRPFACLEGSHISAARTAASAALAAGAMNGGLRSAERLAVCGAGFIANEVWQYLLADQWKVASVAVFDVDSARAKRFANVLAAPL